MSGFDHGPRGSAARAVFLTDEFALWAARPGVRLYLRPLGLMDGAPDGLPLAGGPLSFDRVELVLRDAENHSERAISDLTTLRRWAKRRGVATVIDDRLDRLSPARPSFAGLDLGRPRIMGIVNVTPDSFSDGGDFAESGCAVAHGLALAEAGADILDIGGESTRPGSAAVPPQEEIARIEPVIRDLANRGLTVSVDTRHAAVMTAALAAGARIVNDVTALTGDAGSLDVVVRAGCPVVLTHIQGEPKTMQDAPAYDDVLLDVHDWLAERVAACIAAGVPRGRIAIDPGIGFGKKSLAHNLPLLRGLSLLHGLGCAVLLGVSRKRFIGTLTGIGDPKGRLAGSVAAGLYGVAQGVQFLRVHDVRDTRQALAVWSALQAGTWDGEDDL